MNVQRPVISVRMSSFCKAAVVLAMLVALSGCNRTHWGVNYKPNPALHGESFPRSSAVQVREVSFDLIDKALADTDRLMTARNLAWEDATSTDLADINALQMPVLRVPYPPDAVTQLGVSEFLLNKDPTVAELEMHAKVVGADFVVFGSRLSQRVEHEGVAYQPIYSRHSGVGTAFDNHGNSATAIASGTTTTYQPVTTKYTVNWFQFCAFYYRHNTKPELTH